MKKGLLTMLLAEILPDEDCQFTLRLERGDAETFFAATMHHAELLAQRGHWLRHEPNAYAALLPEGVELLEEAADLAHDWNGFTPQSDAEYPWEECVELGKFWEPDYLLLKCKPTGEIRLCGGCLCFPSSWRLSDKVGRPIEVVHAAVPGLNESIGAGVHKFLAGLKPGVAWLRHNWGLSRSPELNQHPDRQLPRLDATVSVEEVWLRVERQALVALPQSGGVLFGIRIENRPLTEVRADAVAAKGLIRALKTMPEEMARYKNLAAARGRILELLTT